MLAGSNDKNEQFYLSFLKIFLEVALFRTGSYAAAKEMTSCFA